MEEEEEAIGLLDKVLEDEDVFLLEECELGTPTSPGSGSPFLVAVKQLKETSSVPSTGRGEDRSMSLHCLSCPETEMGQLS